jgi:uncharacterized protein with GYD domain
MPTYITFMTFSDQGIRNAKDTVQRAHQFRADLERRGCLFVSEYWTQGRYDIVETFEAPDDQTAMAALLTLCSRGNVRTETLRAFSESEMESIIQKL